MNSLFSGAASLVSRVFSFNKGEMKPNFASSASSISGVFSFNKGEMKQGTASIFGVLSFDQGEVVDVIGGGIWGVLGLCALLSSYNTWTFSISLLDMFGF
jgi:hypothetical protein